MFLVVLWCVVFVCAAVLIGEYTGFLDPSTVGRVMAFIPLGSGSPGPGSAAVPATAEPAAEPSTSTPTPVAAETCTPGQPIFVHGAATLKAALGDLMGDPLECERVTSAAGDTEQRTSAGLVYYRSATNAVVFTNGFDHWALASNGVVHWTGDAVDPPASAEPFSRGGG
ncbi:MAG: hypothetical protein JO352_30455 [Chloroflexi bacterium]|nr:hypothetical protein [Chloroflexota bacterium]MBV9601745.1 hypothetical protein [Chloroflexota bacterium]